MLRKLFKTALTTSKSMRISKPLFAAVNGYMNPQTPPDSGFKFLSEIISTDELFIKDEQNLNRILMDMQNKPQILAKVMSDKELTEKIKNKVFDFLDKKKHSILASALFLVQMDIGDENRTQLWKKVNEVALDFIEKVKFEEMLSNQDLFLLCYRFALTQNNQNLAQKFIQKLKKELSAHKHKAEPTFLIYSLAPLYSQTEKDPECAELIQWIVNDLTVNVNELTVVTLNLFLENIRELNIPLQNKPLIEKKLLNELPLLFDLDLIATMFVLWAPDASSTFIKEFLPILSNFKYLDIVSPPSLMNLVTTLAQVLPKERILIGDLTETVIKKKMDQETNIGMKARLYSYLVSLENPSQIKGFSEIEREILAKENLKFFDSSVILHFTNANCLRTDESKKILDALFEEIENRKDVPKEALEALKKQRSQAKK